MKANNGVHSFLKLVADGGVDNSDVSSPETPQPSKGSAQDLTWDEMAVYGVDAASGGGGSSAGGGSGGDRGKDFSGVVDADGIKSVVNGREVTEGSHSSSTLFHVGAKQQSNFQSRLSALIKGNCLSLNRFS